ncbi:hypothetical protein GCK72_003961 [Caenorhabditis remanei]|uniref:Uncharacterized protein n=1 Tax=Caenorhabditis remanei TaxID=31234 RepID=A0A6A5H9Z0_CAERE|nr:hypothetical protein GCK72_003961 [Caenorhabditis remanei]KAF1764015.1 hypothetical protein GCK72_003961 [Caenorhabditis remanei]
MGATDSGAAADDDDDVADSEEIASNHGVAVWMLLEAGMNSGASGVIREDVTLQKLLRKNGDSEDVGKNSGAYGSHASGAASGYCACSKSGYCCRYGGGVTSSGFGF